MKIDFVDEKAGCIVEIPSEEILEQLKNEFMNEFIAQVATFPQRKVHQEIAGDDDKLYLFEEEILNQYRYSIKMRLVEFLENDLMPKAGTSFMPGQTEKGKGKKGKDKGKGGGKGKDRSKNKNYGSYDNDKHNSGKGKKSQQTGSPYGTAPWHSQQQQQQQQPQQQQPQQQQPQQQQPPQGSQAPWIGAPHVTGPKTDDGAAQQDSWAEAAAQRHPERRDRFGDGGKGGDKGGNKGGKGGDKGGNKGGAAQQQEKEAFMENMRAMMQQPGSMDFMKEWMTNNRNE